MKKTGLTEVGVAGILLLRDLFKRRDGTAGASPSVP
jgi:hypothetical protein